VHARSRITRSQFRHPLERIRVPADLPVPAKSWSDPEWDRIQTGFHATDQHDTWDAFVENNRLYLHDSSTGHGIYEAGFERRGNRWYITDATVETRTDRHQPRPLRDETQLLVRTIDTVLIYRDTYQHWNEAIEQQNEV
jgi:hypothetical protein